MFDIESLVAAYFSDLVFYKSDVDPYSWVSQIKLESSGYSRYVIITGNYIGIQSPAATTISQLGGWKSVQFKDLTDDVKVPISMYIPVQEWYKPVNSVLTQPITIYQRTRQYNVYNTNLGVIISLELDPYRKNCMKYPDSMTLQDAINTFKCTIIKQ